MIGKNSISRLVAPAVAACVMITALSCDSSGGEASSLPLPGIHVTTGETIADASVAHEAVLRTIPASSTSVTTPADFPTRIFPRQTMAAGVHG